MRFTDIHNSGIEKKIIIMFIGITAVGILVSALIMGYFLNKTKVKTYHEIAHSLKPMQEKHEALETVTYTNILSIASNRVLVRTLEENDRHKAMEILAEIEKNLEANSKFHTI